MKTQKEIVVQAKVYAESIGNEDGTSAYDYAKGYTQCQEDMADKKYTEKQLRDAMEEAMPYSKLSQVTQYINSLNKQDNEN
jgi:hypothetical protein